MPTSRFEKSEKYSTAVTADKVFHSSEKTHHDNSYFVAFFPLQRMQSLIAFFPPFSPIVNPEIMLIT